MRAHRVALSKYQELHRQSLVQPIQLNLQVTSLSADYSIAAQVWTQAKAVLITIVWSGVVSLVAFKLVDLTVGLRVSEEAEREGLDITSHGETAYHG